MHNKMKKNILMVIVLVIIAFLAVLCTPAVEQSLSQTEYSGYCLSNGKIRVAIDGDGSLSELCNLETGHNYASGGLLWRLYYDCPSEKEIEISAEDQTPDICIQGDSILISYDSLVVRGEKIAFSLDLAVVLEDDKLRFCSSMISSVNSRLSMLQVMVMKMSLMTMHSASRGGAPSGPQALHCRGRRPSL